MTRFVHRLLAGSRFIILLAVLGTFISAVVLTIYGLVAVVAVALRSFAGLNVAEIDHHDVEQIALEFISLIDVFLLCTVLYIIALGLYELFIDPNLPLPQWLLIEDLDDLKEKLGSVVAVLIAVNFLGDFVQSDGEIGILWLGLGAAAVIIALAVVFAVRPRHGGRGHGGGAGSPSPTPHAPADHAADTVAPKADGHP